MAGGTIKLEYNDDGTPRVSVEGDVPAESQKFVMEALGWGDRLHSQSPADNSPEIKYGDTGQIIAGESRSNSHQSPQGIIQDAGSGDMEVMPEPVSLPPELQAAPGPNLYGPLAIYQQLEGGHIAPPGQAKPILDELIEHDEQPQAIESDALPMLHDNPSVASDPGGLMSRTGNESQSHTPEPVSPPMSSVGPQATLTTAPSLGPPEPPKPPGKNSGIEPPAGKFSPDQWEHLTPQEQQEYKDLQHTMHEAIDTHHHHNLRTAVGRLSELQSKMMHGHAQHEKTKQEAAASMGAPPPEATMAMSLGLGIMTPDGYARVQDWVDMEKGRPLHNAGGGMETLSQLKSDGWEATERGKKGYLRKKNPSTGKYMYKKPVIKREVAKEKGKDQENTYHLVFDEEGEHHADLDSSDGHGFGRVAMMAAANDKSYTMDVHPSALDASDPYQMHKQTITALNTGGPGDQKLTTWAEVDDRGDHHVYRQYTDQQHEILHNVHGPSDPGHLGEYAMSRSDHKSSLPKYKRHTKKFGGTHNQPTTPGAARQVGPNLRPGDEAISGPDGKIWAFIRHDADASRPYQVYEVEDQGFKESRGSKGVAFETKEGAQQAVWFHSTFSRFANSDKPQQLFGGRSFSTELDPKVYPTLHALETGDMNYVPNDVPDPRTGIPRQILVPDIDQSAFFDECARVVHNAVNSALRRNPGADRDAKMADANYIAWNTVCVKPGGGYIPGKGGFLSLLYTTLRASKEGLMENVDRSSRSFDGDDDDESAGSAGRTQASEYAGSQQKTYIPAPEWKDRYMDGWKESQTERWHLLEGRKIKRKSDRAKAMDVFSKELSEVDSRGKAARFSRKYPWAQPPETHNVDDRFHVSGSESTSPEQGSTLHLDEGPIDAMRGVARTMAREATHVTRTMIPIREGFFTELVNIMEDNPPDEEVMGRLMERVRRDYKKQVDSGEIASMPNQQEMQRKIGSWGQEFRANQEIQSIYNTFQRSLDAIMTDPRTPDLLKANPQYRRAQRFILQRKRAALLKTALKDVAPETEGIKYKVLEAIVAAMHSGDKEHSAFMDTLTRRACRKVAKYLGVKADSFTNEDCRIQIGLWYNELRNSRMFKSYVMILKSSILEDEAEKLRKSSIENIVEGLEDQVISEASISL